MSDHTGPMRIIDIPENLPDRQPPPRVHDHPAARFLPTAFSVCARCPGFTDDPCPECPDCPYELARKRRALTTQPTITGSDRGRHWPWGFPRRRTESENPR